LGLDAGPSKLAGSFLIVGCLGGAGADCRTFVAARCGVVKDDDLALQLFSFGDRRTLARLPFDCHRSRIEPSVFPISIFLCVSVLKSDDHLL
jgi:hypothetical protein